MILGGKSSKASRIMHLLDKPWIFKPRKKPCRFRSKSIPGRACAKALRVESDLGVSGYRRLFSTFASSLG